MKRTRLRYWLYTPDGFRHTRRDGCEVWGSHKEFRTKRKAMAALRNAHTASVVFQMHETKSERWTIAAIDHPDFDRAAYNRTHTPE